MKTYKTKLLYREIAVFCGRNASFINKCLDKTGFAGIAALKRDLFDTQPRGFKEMSCSSNFSLDEIFVGGDIHALLKRSGKIKFADANCATDLIDALDCREIFINICGALTDRLFHVAACFRKRYDHLA